MAFEFNPFLNEGAKIGGFVVLVSQTPGYSALLQKAGYGSGNPEGSGHPPEWIYSEMAGGDSAVKKRSVLLYRHTNIAHKIMFGKPLSATSEPFVTMAGKVKNILKRLLRPENQEDTFTPGNTTVFFELK